MAARPGTTVRLWQLGQELRRLREESGRTIIEAAAGLERTHSSLSKIENGKSAIKPRDLRPILDYYKAGEEERQRLLDLAKEGRVKGWWHSYSSTLDQPYMDYITLESEAVRARTFETILIPGLLQTEDYARAIVAASASENPNRDEEKLTAVRMARQSVLNREERPLLLWVILSEAALHHHMGGRAVMKDQLAHLVEVSHQQNVTFQVLPFSHGAHAGVNGAFTVLDLSVSDLSLVLVENISSTLYMERAEEISKYNLAFDHLRMAALPEKQSLALVGKIAKEL